MQRETPCCQPPPRRQRMTVVRSPAVIFAACPSQGYRPRCCAEAAPAALEPRRVHGAGAGVALMSAGLVRYVSLAALPYGTATSPPRRGGQARQ
jgi:hypothetical protein